MNAALAPMRWWHLAACEELERTLFPDDAWSSATLWSELARVPESRHYLVALRDDHVVGYAGLAAVPPEADVQTLAVAPGAQGEGLGAALLGALLDEARARGCTQVFLEVRADNAPALALYERTGFERLSERRGYYGPGLDALVLRRRLTVAAS